MAADLLDLADRLFTGESRSDRRHPMAASGELAQVQPGLAFVDAFSNAAALDTDDGLVVFDTTSPMYAQRVHEALRSWSTRPLHTAVFTHGHVDHVFGVDRYEEEARANGWPAPRVIAHEAVPVRFDRYRETRGYNAVINQRQFRLPQPYFPTDFRYPDETYRRRLDVHVGGEHLELHHARGETDDGTWAWSPARRVVFTGDLFIWASPNCGNPQKVQRYPRDWAVALRTMAALQPEMLLPGHGLPIVGAARVQQALTESAQLLESLLDQTLALMNEGARLDEIVDTVAAPAHLLDRPYLRPVYDEPEFVVRNIWRLYGGWYDGNPARLKPARDAAVAAELAALAGGAGRLADRARELAAAGELRLAGHLAELAALAAPDDGGVHAARAEVFGARAAQERSTMARGVFSWAAAESEAAGDAGQAAEPSPGS